MSRLLEIKGLYAAYNTNGGNLTLVVEDDYLTAFNNYYDPAVMSKVHASMFWNGEKWKMKWR